MNTIADRYHAAAQAVNDWNLVYPRGTKVRYWETHRDVNTAQGFVVAFTSIEARVSAIDPYKAVIGLVGMDTVVPLANVRPVTAVKPEKMPRCPNCNSAEQRKSGERGFFCVGCLREWEPDEEKFDPTIATGDPSRRMEREDARRGPSKDYRNDRPAMGKR